MEKQEETWRGRNKIGGAKEKSRKLISKWRVWQTKSREKLFTEQNHSRAPGAKAHPSLCVCVYPPASMSIISEMLNRNSQYSAIFLLLPLSTLRLTHQQTIILCPPLAPSSSHLCISLKCASVFSSTSPFTLWFKPHHSKTLVPVVVLLSYLHLFNPLCLACIV